MSNTQHTTKLRAICRKIENSQMPSYPEFMEALSDLTYLMVDAAHQIGVKDGERNKEQEKRIIV